MDHDDLTEPLPVQTLPPEPSRTFRPATIAAAAALVAVLAAIGALVWSFSSSDQPSKKTAATTSVKPSPPAKASTVAAQPPPPAPAPASEMNPAPGGAPAGLPPDLMSSLGLGGGSTGGGDASSLLGSPTMDAFAPTAPTTGGGGSDAAPAITLPPPPPGFNGDWSSLPWPQVMPALTAGVSADAIVGLVSNIGGWGVNVGLTTANNATTLLGDLILYAAYTRAGGSVIPAAATSALSSLTSAPASIQSALSTLSTAPTTVQSALATLPSVSLPNVGSFNPTNPLGLPAINPTNPLNMPNLDPAVGLPAAMALSLPNVGAFNPTNPLGLPPPPNVNPLNPLGLPPPPNIGAFNPTNPLGLPANPLRMLPSITRLMGLPF